MVYIGKRDYVPNDCVLAMACKKRFDKSHGDVCEKFAHIYCDYLNSGGILAAVLEIVLYFEKQIIIKLQSHERAKTFFKHIYSVIKYCITEYESESENIDSVMLLYLSGLSAVKDSLQITDSVFIMLYDGK